MSVTNFEDIKNAMDAGKKFLDNVQQYKQDRRTFLDELEEKYAKIHLLLGDDPTMMLLKIESHGPIEKFCKQNNSRLQWVPLENVDHCRVDREIFSNFFASRNRLDFFETEIITDEMLQEFIN